MIRYILVSLGSGILFGALDGFINGNALAQRLYEVYKPIMRTSINVPAGIIIDLVYGLIMARVFLFLYECLPGKRGLLKGIGFALLLWFFRVVMYGLSQWMMFSLPAATLLYTLIAGFMEMLVLGILYGLTLKPPGRT